MDKKLKSFNIEKEVDEYLREMSYKLRKTNGEIINEALREYYKKVFKKDN
jgi:predicted DNA-binding protein